MTKLSSNKKTGHKTLKKVGSFIKKIGLISYQNGAAIKLNTYKHKPPHDIKPIAILLLFHGLNSHINHGGHLAH